MARRKSCTKAIDGAHFMPDLAVAQAHHWVASERGARSDATGNDNILKM